MWAPSKVRPRIAHQRVIATFDPVKRPLCGSHLKSLEDHFGRLAPHVDRELRTGQSGGSGQETKHTLWRYRQRMTLRVECYAGYRGEQEPLAFWLGERRLAVRAIVDRWFAPTQRWFQVDADDGHTYVLRHDEATGHWQLAAYTQGPR